MYTCYAQSRYVQNCTHTGTRGTRLPLASAVCETYMCKSKESKCLGFIDNLQP